MAGYHFDPQDYEELQNIVDFASDMVATPFDASKSYAVGEYCRRESGFYVRNTAGSGAWDASKWTPTTVGDVLKAANAELSALNATLTNINTTSSDASGSVSLASADAWSTVKTINLPAGKYLFLASVVFPANATGYRAVGVSSFNNPTGLFSRDITIVPAVDGFNTSITSMRVLTLTAQSDVHVVARQNSGAAQTVYPSMIAVRLR